MPRGRDETIKGGDLVQKKGKTALGKDEMIQEGGKVDYVLRR